ncbi:DsrE family protein [Halorhodospira neutriphila]|uniref:Uncharacterized protein n=1 Tax=Halorhodospira neutriphila TaxID=168379 RepID=A0ABS1E5F4_9GAMM|nr:DsrE family protein [Halorhodospira neutriphila]MBK1726044.1 hypothetical protein [Halorhodospira neutriphila]
MHPHHQRAEHGRLGARRAVPAALALAVAALAALAPAGAAEAPSQPRLAFHVDMGEPRRVSSTLFNASSAASHYEGQLVDYDIRLVFQGFGIRYVTEEPLAGTPYEVPQERREAQAELVERLRSLQDTYDVQVEVCRSSMAEVGLGREELAVEAKLVPYAVTRLAELQREQGFAYIKMQ